MNRFTQHIPNFVQTDNKPHSFEFKSTEELLNNENIKQFAKHDGFSSFALSGNHLMQILNDGFKWWVIGSLSHTNNVQIPKWNGGKYLAVMPNGEEKVLTNEVVSSCGGELTLKDGTKCFIKMYGKDK